MTGQSQFGAVRNLAGFFNDELYDQALSVGVTDFGTD